MADARRSARQAHGPAVGVHAADAGHLVAHHAVVQHQAGVHHFEAAAVLHHCFAQARAFAAARKPEAVERGRRVLRRDEYRVGWVHEQHPVDVHLGQRSQAQGGVGVDNERVAGAEAQVAVHGKSAGSGVGHVAAGGGGQLGQRPADAGAGGLVLGAGSSGQ